MRLSIRARLTLWHGALLTALLVAVASYLVVQLQRDLVQSVDSELSNSSTVLTHALVNADDLAGSQPWHTLAQEDEDFLEAARAALPRSTSAVQLLGLNGEVVTEYGALTDATPLVDAATCAEAAGRSVTTLTVEVGPHAEEYRVRIVPVTHHSRPLLLLVAASLGEVDGMVRRVLLLLLVAGPAALLATGLSGCWLAGKALRPVARMTADAARVGAWDLHERVAVPATADELQRLALTLNAMLARIERGAQDRQRLVADASHELRSPLAVMRTEIDVSLRGDDLPAEAREVLRSAGEEVDRMRRTVDNLLTLAEADEGGLPLLAVPLSLGKLIQDAARPFAALAEARGERLVVVAGPEEVQADPQQLSLVVANLLDNAVKFTGRGGTVSVRTWHGDDEAGVTVTDDGAGIPAEDVDRVFDRFYRVDRSHSRTIAGSGLGLAICREIVRAHGGRLWAESVPGRGSAFTLALPGWRIVLPAKWPVEKASRAGPAPR